MTQTYILEENELSDFECDQTVIIQKKYLPFIYRNNYTEEPPTTKPQRIDWYPFANSYYPYTEDVDALERVNHLIDSKPSFESLTTLNQISDCDVENDSYSESGAQLKYLQSQPTCFLIIGKPGIGEEKLGKLLADYWKCVYINPEILIQDEIDAGTRAGQCIEFNLRCGRAIGVDVILRLLEKRVKTQSCQHRGFVISGFPLIHNEMYEEDPVSSESAVFNVQEIFEEIFDTALSNLPPQVVANVSQTSKFKDEAHGEGGPPVETAQKLQGQEEEAPPMNEKASDMPERMVEPVDIGSAHADMCAPGEINENYEEQLNFIFAQFDYNFLFIYVMCPNADVISRRSSYRYNILSEELLDLQEYNFNKHMLTIFSKDTGAVNELPLEFFEQDQVSETFQRDYSDKRFLVQLPKDFAGNVSSQLERYHYAALSVIERHVLLHDPQYFIKVDGRCTALRMFNTVKSRLRILPLQKVLLPEKINTDQEQDVVGEDDEQQQQFNIKDATPEECFEAFQKKKIAGPLFKWTWSNWGSQCPVSMKEGHYKVGDPRYAVTFMNKIFFLNNENAFVKFSWNPRPYLLPPFPKLSCKIFVIGPPISGKTAISKCLAYLLNGSVICPADVEAEFILQKKTELKERIANAAMNEAIALLTNKKEDEWRKKEEERQKSVQEWVNKCVEVLQEYVDKRAVIEAPDEDVEEAIDINEISSFPLKLATKRYSMEEEDDEEEEEENANEFAKKTASELNLFLKINNIACADDIERCKELLLDHDKLLEYLPERMKYKEYEPEPVSVFDDFVTDYVENAVNEENYQKIQLTKDDLYEMFSARLREIEDKNEEKGNNRGGWVIDGLPFDQEVLEMLRSEFTVDDVFIFNDDDPEHAFLLQRYGTDTDTDYDDFRNFFTRLGKTDAAWRSPSSHILKTSGSDNATSQNSKSGLENIPSVKRTDVAQSLEEYQQQLETFDSTIEDIKNYFESKFIQCTLFNINNKTLEEVLEEIVDEVDGRYKQNASAFTADDRAQEAADIGEPATQNDEIGAEEMEEEKVDGELFLENRRYGDTYHYCPVVFHKHWVLWKGKEEYAVKFENKLYLCSNENSMNRFLQHPRKYLLQTKPPSSFPPPRICVTGPKSCGKTTVSKALCENFGLYYVNYIDLLKETIDTEDTFDTNDLNEEDDEEGGAPHDIFYDYITYDRPLPENVLDKVLGRCWFEDPLKNFGFVLDNFPFRPSDIDHMERKCFIPDAILELSVSESTLRNRNLEMMITDWKSRMETEQTARDAINREIMDDWEEKRATRFKELMEIRRENRYEARIMEKSNREPEKHTDRPYLEDLQEVDEETDRATVKSEVTFDSVAEQADVEEVNLILAEEMPAPTFEDNFETYDEAIERLDTEIEEAFATETGFLKVVRDYCDAEQIPWVRINGELSTDGVIAQAFRTCAPFKFRNSSLFERCYDVTVEIAEKLLSVGYFFQSKFGRTCPVQYFEDKIPLQLFLPLEQKFKVFPMIHRQYIYFLAGKQNRDKFKVHPLKYISQVCFNFPLIPAKVAVNGPPKCGKSTLSARFLQEYGLKVITRGSAVRYVLEYLPHCQLALDMESVLRKGWELTDEMVIRSIEAASFDPKCATQGMVLDGVPNTPGEVRHLARVGLVPHLVIELDATREQIEECLSTDFGRNGMRVYSKHLIAFRYAEWLKSHGEFRHWFDREYQVLSKIQITPSKWGIWCAVNEYVLAVFSEIKHYYRHCKQDWPLRLANMQVTPLEFVERRSSYKSYCPCCLHYFNSLNSGGEPPDRTGLVQFRKYFYWLCETHIEEFFQNPEPFLPPYNQHALPQDLPEFVSLSEMPANAHENGVCIVCYKENLPKRELVQGDIKNALRYRDKIYLFDGLDCLKAFMRYPHKYFTISVKALDTKAYTPLKYRELPTLGLLEQYVAKQLVRAVTRVAIDHPIIPGLTVEESAAIAIGLYLKINNPKTPSSYVRLYEDGHRLFLKRSQGLTCYLKKMKDTLNPYLHYDEPMPEFSLPEPRATPSIISVKSSQSQVSMIEIVDEILDRLCYPE